MLLEKIPPLDELRDRINERKGVVVGVALGVLLVAVLLVARGCRSPQMDRAAAASNKAFFSADDGKTWFADLATRVPPFDAPGGKAYRARVYRCGADKLFVNHLEGYPEPIRLQLEAVAEVDRGMRAAQFAGSLQVKRPGEAKWVSAGIESADVARFNAVVAPKHADCPPDELKPEAAK